MRMQCGAAGGGGLRSLRYSTFVRRAKSSDQSIVEAANSSSPLAYLRMRRRLPAIQEPLILCAVSVPTPCYALIWAHECFDTSTCLVMRVEV
ncbi:uncharacterized protein BDZ99DRAFT_184171 [Mytilinidion resinicola]|uniref:Uncharacterized protein n=1 Tax=Mytilinidion resinicola TaxID=574789 RepID=A0A6A6Z0R0_9PEZI|nr:uncharacterized protein BDZ99DRAFT_184171 [Mytilinidion resinicola]KAF2814752.1 hypothetical protein BDZ99DRAFT_184171 [Mytilinidion resinicola]